MKRALGIAAAVLMALLVANVAVRAQAEPAAAAAPTCFGRSATLVGTSGDDELEGTVGRVDVIVLGAGADVVLTVGEDGPAQDVGDFICGGPGQDHLGGTAGQDHIAGGGATDRIEGWRGADTLKGKGGDDVVVDDSIESQDFEDDVLRGGAGDDHLAAGWGQDRLHGFIGDDELIDLECDGPTRMYGGAGGDAMVSYQSSFDGVNCGDWSGSNDPDVLVGGRGNDAADVLRNDSVTGVETVTVRRYSG